MSTAAGRIIRQLRTERGWTQQQLGDKLGMDRALVAERELGRTKVPVTEFVRFAQVFGMPADQFRSMIEAEDPAEPNVEAGIPVLNRGPGGLVLDYEHHTGELRPGAESLERDGKTRGEGLFALVVVGNSMSPSLADGDRAIFSPVPGRYEPRLGESIVCVRLRDGRNVVGIFNRKAAALEIKKLERGAKPTICKPEDIAQVAVLI